MEISRRSRSGNCAFFVLFIGLAVLLACGFEPEVAPAPTGGLASGPPPITPMEPGPGVKSTPVEPASAAASPTSLLNTGPVEETPAPSPTSRPEPTTARAVVVMTPISDVPGPNPTSPKVANDELASLVEGNTTFALDLYRQLALSAGNLFYSPYGISLALAMAYAGAGGETGEQMSNTLRFGLTQDRLHPVFNALDLQLASRSAGGEDGGFELNIANSVWGQEAHPFLPAYLDTLAANYGGEIREGDFRRDPEGSREEINQWVAAETNGRIEDLLARESITPLTRLVLANAVYFKAEWASPFDESVTSPRPFHALDGGEARVPMMGQAAGFGYARGDGFQAVDLPYAGGDVSMTVLLPDEGRFNDVESFLDADLVGRVLRELEVRMVRLSMPKFDLESTFDLSDVLAEMGMPNAFDEKKAELRGMDGLSCLAGDDQCLWISEVAHKAFVSVDEAGTEAAAATAAVAGITRAEPEPPIEVTIDRPFIFLIRDRDTGAVLFLGRIVSLG